MDATNKTFIGISPAGVEWYAYKPEHVEPMRARLNKLRNKAAQAQAQDPMKAARERYRRARARVMTLKGRANRAKTRCSNTWNFPGYAQASDECTAARKALRKLEKKAGLPAWTPAK